MATLNLGPIWFVADFDSQGKITRMEEHDFRCGGGIKIPKDVEPNEYFLSVVKSRTAYQPHLDKAEEFIKTRGLNNGNN